jgi:hypothetical protein
VVQRRVDSINTDDICAELLEKRDITLASSFVCERICEGGCARRSAVGADILLICNTADEEFGTVLVEEMRPLTACISRLYW